MAHAGVVADVGRRGSKQGQQFDGVLRAVDDGCVARELRQEVLFGRSDHKLRAQPEGRKLHRDLPKTRKRPAFAEAAGAGVDENRL